MSLLPVGAIPGVVGAYDINNSLRFRRSASAWLNRTNGTSTNQSRGTWSFWFKRGQLGVAQRVFEGKTANTDAGVMAIEFFADDTLVIGGWNANWRITTQVFRDPSAWYHIVLAVDTTQSTANNRILVYVNGTQITAFGTINNPVQNSTFGLNNNSSALLISRDSYALGRFTDGYLAEVNCIDGQTLTPSSFGETNTTTGVWQPKAYTGTYGSNGYYLKFSDIALTSGSNTGLGRDFSGNGNFFNTNGISVTAGTTYDAMTDSPTNTSATVANYATLNPVDNPSSSNSLANANLTASTAGASGWRGIRATMAFPTTGKWYYEVTLTSGTNNLFLGIVSSAATGVYHDHADTFAVRMSDCVLRPSGATATGTQAGYAVGDIFGVAIDCSTPTVQFYKNGSLNVTYTSPTFDPSKTYFPCFLGNDTGASATHNFNFGQRPFVYTPPTGFVALNTFNLPTPTILQGNRFMDATLWTGNGSLSRTITNAALFKPDLVWIKNRSNAYSHALWDSIRGTGGNLLASNSTDAENTYGTLYQNLSSFNSNGFTLGSVTSLDVQNATGQTQVGWQWQAGQGSTSSNTSGSITTTTSVSTTAGFSIATFTAPSTNQSFTVGHGLGVAPRMTIVKRRDSSFGASWWVWHIGLGDNTSSYLVLNSTNAAATEPSMWGTVGRTSTVCGFNAPASIIASGTYVLYSWAEIAGFSKFTSYTGNGSADGPFVYCGFRPKYILIKRTSAVSNWLVSDTSRSPYNNFSADIYPNISDAEYSSGITPDFLSNGFKIRTADTTWNTSGGTFIVAAFAENPFKNANAR